MPTRLWLAADGSRAGGVLLQRLPDESRNQDADAWERTVHLTDTVKAEELLGLDPLEVLRRLYHEESVRVFPSKALCFGCTCSRERIAHALLTLGEQELREVLAERGGIETQCHFCHSRYRFDEAEVEMLLAEPGGEASPTLH